MSREKPGHDRETELTCSGRQHSAHKETRESQSEQQQAGPASTPEPGEEKVMLPRPPLTRPA